MIQLLAHAAVALDASTGPLQLNAVADRSWSIQNNSFSLLRDHQILVQYAGGIGLVNARINTGSLMTRGFPQVSPINATVIPPTNPNICDLRDYPINLRAVEAFRMDVTNGAANDAIVASWIATLDHNFNVNRRDLRWIRFTTTNTLTALTWSAPSNITFTDQLEGGYYDVYGMFVQSADAAFARIIFPDQLYTPGCPVNAAITGLNHPIFRGGLGKWGSFSTQNLPQFDAIGQTAGAENIVGFLLCGKAL